MGRLTGGHIRFNERRKIGDYEHRDVEIVLQFSFEEGGFNPGFFDGIQSEIRARVQAMVANKDSPVPVKEGWAAAIDKVAADEATPELPKPKRGRPKSKPVEEIPDPEMDGPATGEPSTIDDVIDEDEDDEEVLRGETISADDVVAAVKAKNLKIGDPARLKAIIKKYAPTSKEIPADKRAAFLKELEKVK